MRSAPVSHPIRRPASTTFHLRQTVAAVLCAVGTLAMAAGELPAVGPTTLPQGGQIRAGQGAISVNGATLNVNQQSQKLITNWDSFNIGANATVNFNQPGANAAALNRITGQDPTQIYGQLNANGQVFLINPNGVLFGRTATVNVGGLTASTLNLSDENFLAGRNVFERNGATGSVVNLGSLTTADGGYLALLAPEVRNEGALVARMGTVAMAGGDRVTLELSGSQLVSITVDPATIATLIQNKNLVDVGGGQVILSTAAANQLLGAIVNNSGTINASSVASEGGRVFLKGDGVYTGGRISADGTAGGEIRVTGRDVTTAGLLSATGSTGAGGTIDIAASQELWQIQSTHMDVTGARGGKVAIDGGTFLVTSATVVADGRSGTGGAIDVTADEMQLLSANMRADGATQGGRVRVGGEWQGGKDLASDEMRNAQTLSVNESSRLSASSTLGAGGEVVMWSEKATDFRGSAYATGQGRQGGRIEVSSTGQLNLGGIPDAGVGGTVLLDPKNIVIDDPDIALIQDSLSMGVDGTGNLAVGSIRIAPSGYAGVAKPRVALSGDGKILVVGDGDRDQVFVYGFDSGAPGQGALKSRINAAERADNSLTGSGFGSAVATHSDGREVAVGAPKYASNSGKVYVFDRDQADFIFNCGAGLDCLVAGYFVNYGLRETMTGSQVDSATWLGATQVASFGQAVAFGGSDGFGSLYATGGFNGNSTGSAIYRWNQQSGLYLRTPEPASTPRSADLILNGNFSVDVFNMNKNVGRYIAADENNTLIFTAEGARNDETPGSGTFRLTNAQQAASDRKIALVTPDEVSGLFGTYGSINSLFSRTPGPVALSADGLTSAVSQENSENVLIQSPNPPEYNNSYRARIGNIEAVDSFVINPSGKPVSPRTTGMAFDATGQRMVYAVDGQNGGNAILFMHRPSHVVEHPDAANGQTFAFRPTENSLITPGALRQVLNTGASLVLQANNDITVNKSVLVDNPSPSGRGGNLTLQAGRSVLLNANIQTDGGNLTVVANETNANGVIAANRDSGDAVISMANGATINAGAGNVSLTIANGAGRSVNFAQSGDITLGTINAGSITATHHGSSGNIVANGSLTASLRDVALTADVGNVTTGVNGVIQANLDARLIATRGNVTTNAALTAHQNATLSAGSNVTTNGSVSADRDATFTAENNVTTNGDVRASAGDVVLTAVRSVTMRGAISGGNVDITGNTAATPSTPVAVVKMEDLASITASGDVNVRVQNVGTGGDMTLGTITANRITAVNSGQTVGGVAGDVVLNSGATLTARGGGDAIVLAAASGGNFVNNGATLSTPNNGRWLVYSADPDALGQKFGPNDGNVLQSGQLPVWGQSYSTRGTHGDLLPPLSGNRYVFSQTRNLDLDWASSSSTSLTRDLPYDGKERSAQEIFENVQINISATPSNNGAQLVTNTYRGAFSAAVLPNTEVLSSTSASGVATFGGDKYKNVKRADLTNPDSEVQAYTIGYTVNGTGVPTSPTGYTIRSTGGAVAGGQASLTITPVDLTITARDQSKTYGDQVSFSGTEFTIDANQLKNGETIGGVTLSSDGAPATAGVNGAPYTIAVSGAQGGTFNIANYTPNYVNGNLTVNRAPLTIIAKDKSKTYGDQVSFSGTDFTTGANQLKNGETIGGVTLSSDGAPATAGVNGAPYTIAVSGAQGGTFNIANYTPNYVNGNLTVNRAPLTIILTADQCRIEGDSVAAYEFEVKGYVNNDAQSYSGSPVIVSASSPDVLPEKLSAGASQSVKISAPGSFLPSSSNYTFDLSKSSDSVSINILPSALGTTLKLMTEASAANNTALNDTSSPESGKVALEFVADKSNNARFVSPSAQNLANLSGNGAALVKYVGARYADRQERFSSALSILETNPSLADLAQCKPGDAPETLCIPSAGTPQFGGNPSAEIRRKVAYVFANQAYDARKGVKALATPYADADAIGKILRDDYGYDVEIVRDATRRDMVLTLKKAAEAHARDESVVMYYAGHGVEFADKSSSEMMGYWLPVDANANDPRTWLSNADIGKFMQLLPAKQVMVVSDSCFSGRLAMEQKLDKGDIATRRAELLSKRAVTVMSSGNFEEVDDAGKGDHSIFAWSLIEELKAAKQAGKMLEGNDLFNAVKGRVHAEKFVQTPQYSAIVSAGYEPGAEFFLEKR
jgi:filamentous hemagglutinin family protein